ncbi:bnr asp-box repeat domain protein [Paraphaeosphaeria sporulosa]
MTHRRASLMIVLSGPRQATPVRRHFLAMLSLRRGTNLEPRITLCRCIDRRTTGKRGMSEHLGRRLVQHHMLYLDEPFGEEERGVLPLIPVYYSDQRDPKHEQKLVQQTTEGNFDSWEPTIDMVASNTYEDCPVMPIITKENANKEPWHKLVAGVGTQPNGGPHAIWTPLDGPNATIVAKSSKAVNDGKNIRIAGGAEYEAPPPGKGQVSVMDLKKALGV